MEWGGKSDWEFGINIVFQRECCCSDGKLWYNLRDKYESVYKVIEWKIETKF